jgi:hypothetical protein
VWTFCFGYPPAWGNDFRLLRCPAAVFGDRNASAAKPYSAFDRRSTLQRMSPTEGLPIEKLHPSGKHTVANMAAKGWIERLGFGPQALGILDKKCFASRLH